MRRSKLKHLFFDINREEFKEWFKKQPLVCTYCGISEAEWEKGTDSLRKAFKRL
jgi:hypothetical protein